jgi:hypothetical protein
VGIGFRSLLSFRKDIMYIMCPQHALGDFSKCFPSILKTLAQNGNVLQVRNLDRTKDPLHPEELVDQRSEGFTKRQING